MKFTDGFWQMRPEVTPHYPVQVHEVEIEPEALTIHASTKKLETRGDTLNLSLLTVRFSTPMDNVIRVQMVHHTGGLPRKPQFNLSDQPHSQPVISDDEHYAALTSGDLSVRVHKGGDWLVEYKAEERVITSSSWTRILHLAKKTDCSHFHHKRPCELNYPISFMGCPEHFLPTLSTNPIGC